MKRIGGCIYVHKSSMASFNRHIFKNYIAPAMAKIPYRFNFAIVKFNKKDKVVTFIKSDNWDTAREPNVGDAIRVDLRNNTTKLIKEKGQIYHHKWMFVDDNYKGFNIEQSKEWSELWQRTLPNTKEVKSRIGYRKYWNEILEKYNLPIE